MKSCNLYQQMTGKIGFVGCRVRPFMENCFRFGYEVCAVDGFNDWDAAHFGNTLQKKYTDFGSSSEFLRSYEKLGGTPVIFCGPVEVDPSVIEKASMRIKVLNAPASAVAACRRISFMEEAATDGVSFPPVSADPPKTGGRWIVKNVLSAGGTGIREDNGKQLRGGEYRQQFVEGFSMGASFLSTNTETALMGISRHIKSCADHFGPKEFQYAGFLYPYPAEVSAETLYILQRFGQRVSSAAGIVGWWGADFITNDNSVFLLEINPRFTASMELLARAHGIDLVGTQVAALENQIRLKPNLIKKNTLTYGTAVCYSKKDCVFNGARKWFEQNARDIPHDGKNILKGEPILSLYAVSGSPEGCMDELVEKAGKLYESFL